MVVGVARLVRKRGEAVVGEERGILDSDNAMDTCDGPFRVLGKTCKVRPTTVTEVVAKSSFDGGPGAVNNAAREPQRMCGSEGRRAACWSVPGT